MNTLQEPTLFHVDKLCKQFYRKQFSPGFFLPSTWPEFDSHCGGIYLKPALTVATFSVSVIHVEVNENGFCHWRIGKRFGVCIDVGRVRNIGFYILCTWIYTYVCGSGRSVCHTRSGYRKAEPPSFSDGSYQIGDVCFEHSTPSVVLGTYPYCRKPGRFPRVCVESFRKWITIFIVFRAVMKRGFDAVIPVFGSSKSDFPRFSWMCSLTGAKLFCGILSRRIPRVGRVSVFFSNLCAKFLPLVSCIFSW